MALDIFNLASPDVLTQITLAVLALVVFASLGTKDSIENLSKKLIRPKSADDFFWKRKRSIDTDLSQAKYIGIVGASLSRTLRDYSAILEDRIKLGATVRVILMDPNSTAPDQAVLRSKGVINRQFYLDTLRPTIERVGILSNYSNKVDLGLLPYKPAFGMIVIDPDEPYGKIIVEMYPHHSDSFAPTFELEPSHDTHWYKFFREQFENLWNGCNQRHFVGKEIYTLVEEIRSISS
ncbi:MAG: hypothetical protein KME47_17155 [Nodosilinea sp. WJT8-NPBG4]|nr:hypothetical protein [Nodosilinea sp. WJT8-NPBG4]